MNKRFLIALGAVAVLFAGCDFGGDKEENGLGVLLPENSDLVFYFNHADRAQVEALRALLDRFPKESLDVIDSAFEEAMAGGDSEVVDYSPLLRPFLVGDWELMAGVKLGDDVTVNDEGAVEEAVLVGEFDAADEFEELVNKITAKSGKEFKKSRNDGIQYWENADGNLYLARDGGVFVLANSRKVLDESLQRMDQGQGGMAGSGVAEKMANLSADYMGYGYISEGAMKRIDGEVTADDQGLGEAYGVMVVEEGGMRFLANQQVGDFTFGSVDLRGKLPDQAVIVFSETMGLEKNLTSVNDPLVDDFFAGLRKYKAILNAPVAFVVGDKGMLLPSFGLYAQVSDLDLAKEVLNQADSYSDMVISEFDGLIAGSGYEGEGLLKREVVLINGAPVRKLYLDFSVIPPEVLNGVRVYLPKVDFNTLKVEFYYGLDSNNLLFATFYPGLDEYKGPMLAENDVMAEAFDGLKLKELDTKSFFDLTPLFVIADQYVEMAKGSQFVNAATVQKNVEVYEAVKAVAETVDYVVGGSKMEEGVLRSESFLKVGVQ